MACLKNQKRRIFAPKTVIFCVKRVSSNDGLTAFFSLKLTILGQIPAISSRIFFNDLYCVQAHSSKRTHRSFHRLQRGYHSADKIIRSYRKYKHTRYTDISIILRSAAAESTSEDLSDIMNTHPYSLISLKAAYYLLRNHSFVSFFLFIMKRCQSSILFKHISA